eukprot:scaffold187339_cov13-Tisochrysis_lutea.AAC.1
MEGFAQRQKAGKKKGDCVGGENIACTNRREKHSPHENQNPALWLFNGATFAKTFFSLLCKICRQEGSAESNAHLVS